MIVWALDLGTKCGWAVRTGAGNLVSGTWDMSPKRGDSGGIRFLRFERNMNNLYEETGEPGLVAFEIVHAHKGTIAAQVYGGFMGILQRWCEVMHIPYAGIPVSDVKKRACGKGNSPKKLVEAAARQKWPEQMIVDDNQADALWLLTCAEEDVTP